MTYPKKEKVTPVHPIPRMCRWFGHYWHNEHNRRMQLGTDECLRDGCPGDGHLWVYDYRDDDDVAHEHCRYEGCTEVRTWQVPNLSGLIPAVPQPHDA